MKALFPSTGIVILTKNDVDKLHNFYIDNLANSKLFEVYKKSNYSIQVGNSSYLPKKSTIVLENANLLTIKQLHQIVRAQISVDDNTPLEDNFILDNPFFKTLKHLN